MFPSLYASLIFTFVFAISAFGQAPRPPVPQAGGRVEIPDTGFSIVPPTSWDVTRNSYGSSLLFNAPKTAGVYQATIQVMTFQGYRYIDDLTQQEFGKLIVEKFSNVSNIVQNYRLRSEEKIKLESGDDAILYYTEFNYNEFPIMQMHILISSGTHHFLMTYTDLAHTFETENSPALAIAYGSMQSALVSSRPPSRFQTLIIGSVVASILMVVWFSSRFYRARRMARMGARLEEEDSREIQADEEITYYSRQQPISEVDREVKDTRPSRSAKTAATARPVTHTQPASQQASRHAEPSRPPSSIPRTQTGAWPQTENTSPRSSLPPKTPPRSAPPLSLPTAPARSAPQSMPDIPRSKPAAPARAKQVTTPPQSHDLKEKSSRHTPPLTPQDEDLSEEARLSQILPKAGAVDHAKDKKKRGLFWKKAADEGDEEPMSEAWAVDPGEESDRSEGNSEPVSEAWALGEDSGPEEGGPALTATSAVWALDSEPSEPVSEVAVKGNRGKSKGSEKAKPEKDKGRQQAAAEAEDEAEEDSWNLASKRVSEDDDEEVG